MNTKDKGDLTVAIVTVELLKLNKIVLLPYGDNQPYDLAVDEGQLIRVQCKTGWLESNKNGVIAYSTCSTYKEHGKLVRHQYYGKIDCFAVYYPVNGKIYWVPIKGTPKGRGYLRLDEPKTKIKNTHFWWAKDYEKWPYGALPER